MNVDISLLKMAPVQDLVLLSILATFRDIDQQIFL